MLSREEKNLPEQQCAYQRSIVLVGHRHTQLGLQTLQLPMWICCKITTVLPYIRFKFQQRKPCAHYSKEEPQVRLGLVMKKKDEIYGCYSGTIGKIGEL